MHSPASSSTSPVSSSFFPDNPPSSCSTPQSPSPSLQRQRSSPSEPHSLPDAKRLRPNLSLSFDVQEAVREEWRQSVLAQLGEQLSNTGRVASLAMSTPMAQRRPLRTFDLASFGGARSLAIPYLDTPPHSSSFLPYNNTVPHQPRIPGVRSTVPTPSTSPDAVESDRSSYILPTSTSSTTDRLPRGPPQFPAGTQCSLPSQYPPSSSSNQNDAGSRNYVPVRKSTSPPSGIAEVQREPQVCWPEASTLGGGSPPVGGPPRRGTDPGPCSGSCSDTGSKEKEKVVSGLVSASVLAIESIWGVPAAPTVEAGAVIPLSWFVTEVLRRSRTSCSTLQVALYYLHKSRRQIREVVAQCETLREKCSYPSPPLTPADESGPGIDGEPSIHEIFIQEKNNPVLCGRRMFLAALISASKFLQDRNFSNRAWAKISGLPVLEINLNERVFLNLIKFELHVSAPDFQKWVQRLATLPTPSKESPSSTSRKNGLARSASEYPPAEPMHDLTLPVRSASTNQLGRARSHPQLVTGRRHSSLPRAPRLPVVVDVAADPAAELDPVDAPIPPTPEESSCSASNASLSEDEEEEEESRSPRQYRQLPRERSASNYGKISRARAYAQAMDVDPLPSSNCRQASSSFSGVPAWANSHNVVA